MSNLKVIIWGFPLDTHTHSYTHAALYEAFKYLEYETYWFHGGNYPDPNTFDYSNSLFITEGFADTNIPIVKSSTYFVHNAVNPGKYLEKDARLVDIRFNVSDINDYNYNMVINRKEFVDIDDASFYNPKADDSVLGDKYKKGLNGYEALHTIWATNLLPNQFNFEDRFIKRDNKFYFIGTIGGSPAVEMQKVANTLESLGIEFVYHKNPWVKPATNEENKLYMQKSIISLDVRGTDSYHTNSDGNVELHGRPVTGGNHKKIGFIPCRTIKQISYGRLPGTNSVAVKKLFGDYVIYNDDESKLPIDCLEYEKNPNYDLVYESMRYVRENHTFVNRANVILKVFNKEV